ncbi:HNH endonuclease [Mycobacterium phage PotatoSplit]|uniref:HNH endonuclease domain protein n=12 Tax=Microwolfvirus TaxID=2942894 RepID=A0A0A7S2J4_9CAUD|nr:HNH endonuclease [Mycobacterium phage Jobu08]YP_010060135.1 HNH endonuclease [Mycobacterium phage Zetzy]AJA43391.1 HNH endonuclease domain protein [Mycobacterium phage Taurus]ALF00969.1 HNH endonuclease [Mycobacterium phage Wooldri]ALY07715.1 HNH endonuclease domain protein [Mycobacterium phage JenCasNa]AMO43681.1 HNH endonuclease [Mycobacterium phage Marie]AVE00197.1 HNH endonuclease [Mycobacterium phage LugYA]AXC33818.1 HNH endonuclease [Mycobacterium phage Sabia]AXH65243.1 HNH endonuc
MVSLSWSTSDRSTRLPDDWPAIRRQVLRDAGWICEIGWSGCLLEATEVDHIRRGDDHSRANLRAACSSCHGKKSSAEGNARKRQLRARRKRPTERHPGRI